MQSQLKTHRKIVIAIFTFPLLYQAPACIARGGGGGGHAGGGASFSGGGAHFSGGGGYHGGNSITLGNGGGNGGGGFARPSGYYNRGRLNNGYGYGYGGYGYGGYGYGGYGYGYGGYGGYGYDGGYNQDSQYTGGGTQNQPPPFMQDDPLRDYYKQQEANSAAATASVSSSVMTAPQPSYQQQLPTDLGFAQTAVSVNAKPTVRVDEANDVRDNFHGSGLFTAVWWKRYKNAWFNAAASDDWVWRNTDWNQLATFLGQSAGKPPTDYDYGNNIHYLDGKIYYGENAVATAANYYKQAQTLAKKGSLPVHSAPPTDSDWKPLGVFSLVHSGQKFSNLLFDLAIAKNGQIHGNCYNVMTDQLDTVTGAMDKSNWRVSWTVGASQTVVYDSGLANLIDAQSPILVHLGPEHAEQCMLVRLRQPAAVAK